MWACRSVPPAEPDLSSPNEEFWNVSFNQLRRNKGGVDHLCRSAESAALMIWLLTAKKLLGHVSPTIREAALSFQSKSLNMAAEGGGGRGGSHSIYHKWFKPQLFLSSVSKLKTTRAFVFWSWKLVDGPNSFNLIWSKRLKYKPQRLSVDSSPLISCWQISSISSKVKN